MLNLQEKHLLRATLCEIRGMPKIVYSPGICGSLLEAFSAGYKYIFYCQNIWREWPHYSGVRAFPVPRGYNCPLWTGTAGALRYDLLDFLITRLSADIAETEAEDAACGHDEFPLSPKQDSES